MPEQSSQNQDKFIVRLPDGLRDRIRLAAEANHRSMNAEVVALLEENHPAPVPEKLDDPAARLLFWLAKRIRRRNPKPGTPRDKQAALYERIAGDIAERMKDIGE
ncbi:MULTISPECIES: Arc family DNA-binding protein [Pseudosulfitobacter]|uniref:Arc family DNA-binding protein n=1 Tax=Pseudosulfitobacter pseudonitzschiae TaxID=1402135 RepID=UPI0015830D66|nr:Arc family DNA-binding protein [Pseudosulfitobacter pseudonitzschiae]QKS09503.1 Arc family DNA-binding protein [Pseudosulfitobacter pseudonitzschiae]